MDIIVRYALETEAAKLSDIAVASKKYWDYPDSWIDMWAPERVINPGFISSNYVRVAIQKKEIVGFSAISLNDAEAELEHMWVLPAHIKQGIGKLLLMDAMQFCKKRFVHLLRIESDPNAKAFYEKMGAYHIGYVDSKPKPRKLPVLIMNIQRGDH